MKNGARILVLTGDGKGKTTSAMGMALRAVGHGMNVCIVQFIKQATSGEIIALRKLPGVEITQSGRGFLPRAEEPAFAGHCRAAREGLAAAGEAIRSGRFGLVILDEVCVAVARGLLAEQDVVQVVEQAPADMCVVLSGRGATPGLIELADTVTEMRSVKHGFDEGLKAQKGVEM